MRRSADGALPLGAHAVPHARLRGRGGHVAAPSTRTSTTAPAWRRRRSGHGLGAPVGRDAAPGRVDRGQGGGAHQAPGTDIKLERRGPHWIPCAGATTCPTASSSPARSRTRSNGEVTLLVPGRLRRPRGGGRAVPLRGRQGRGRLGRARRGVPDRDARHRRRRAPPGRARHRHQLRDRRRHQGDPARREDRRHDPHGDRHELPGDRRRNDSAVHWDMVCDLRQGGSITVDGEELQPDGKFSV